jgi:hypothetical protein
MVDIDRKVDLVRLAPQEEAYLFGSFSKLHNTF